MARKGQEIKLSAKGNFVISLKISLPRIRLAYLPTPLEYLPRLSKYLGGPKIWIKRDDLTGPSFGGNKVRKLEFVMADALNKGSSVVITTGSVQSNHARATAAVASKLGLKAVLVLRGKEPSEVSGNLLLDRLFGAEIRFFPVEREEIPAIMEEVADELRKKGEKPYIIPLGASYPIGAVGYANSVIEIRDQAREMGLKIDWIVHAAGSGGTQAGLVFGTKMLKMDTKVLGISMGPDAESLRRASLGVAEGISGLLGLDVQIGPQDFRVVDDYVEEGKISRRVVEAMKILARTEGIMLDPVYTAKAMLGLIELTRNGFFDANENVLFIHTGGLPGLFAHGRELSTFIS